MGQFGMRNAQFGILGTSLSGDAVLSRCFAFGSRLSCGSVGMSGVWFTPAVRFCWDVWRSVHACLFSFVRKRETACDILRFYSRRGSGSPLERSRIAVRLSGFVGSLRVCPFLCGDPDGVTGDAGDERRGYEETRLAARPLCAFARAHWPCRSFRGEFVGGCAPPNLRQRAIGSLDSLHLIRGVGSLYAGKPCAFYAAVIIDRAARPCRRS